MELSLNVLKCIESGLLVRRKHQQRRKSATAGPGGAVLFWHVDDIDAMLEKLKSMGAKEYEPLTKREEGFITASVTDPFGNILGIIFNPHYLLVLARSDDMSHAVGIR